MAESQGPGWEVCGEHLESSLEVRDRDLGLLKGPRQLRYGGADIEKGSLRVRVGRRPIAMNLATLYRRRGRAVPEEYMVYEGHNIWLLNHSMGILRGRGALDASHVYYEIELADDRAIITEVLPQPKFLRAGPGGPRCEAEIRLNGRAVPIAETEFGAAPAGSTQFGRVPPAAAPAGAAQFDRLPPAPAPAGAAQFDRVPPAPAPAGSARFDRVPPDPAPAGAAQFDRVPPAPAPAGAAQFDRLPPAAAPAGAAQFDRVPPAPTLATPAPAAPTPADNIFFGAELNPFVGDDAVGRVSFPVLTTHLQAAGAGDAIGQWILERGPEPFSGDQSLMELVLLDRHVRRLSCRVRVSASVTSFFGFPLKLKGGWVPLDVDLM